MPKLIIPQIDDLLKVGGKMLNAGVDGTIVLGSCGCGGPAGCGGCACNCSGCACR